MSETLEELKSIVDNAPDGATHIDDDLLFYIKDSRFGLRWHNDYDGLWFRCEVPETLRSLSDIKRIIELMGQVNLLNDSLSSSCAYCGAPAE